MLGQIDRHAESELDLGRRHQGFFDHVCHEQLVELLQQRIADPQMLWLIRRFLKAGVMIEGRREDTDEGVPQGAVLSPLLANVYLHYVLDRVVRARCETAAAR